ncbi:MAG TPA: hypothetical protein VE086_05330 [Chthoniobacterales bacterium]|nr:hypothetical protein [Chthoniobacterales bacterium]
MKILTSSMIAVLALSFVGCAAQTETTTTTTRTSTERTSTTDTTALDPSRNQSMQSSMGPR